MERFLLYATGIESNLCASFYILSNVPPAMAFSPVNLLDIQGFGCANGGCVSAAQAWKLRGLLAWGYFVSGCDDT